MKAVSSQRSAVSSKMFLFILAAMLFALCVPAEAQQPQKVHRIALLMSSSTGESTRFIAAFRQGMRELGYVEGTNVILEIRGGAAKPDRLAALAAELVGLNPAIIVTGGSSATRAAEDATSTIPIVMRYGADPVRAGFVASLAQPGGNITGVASINLGLIGKRFELLLETVPGVKRIVALAAQTYQNRLIASDENKEMEAAARALGVKLQVLSAQDAKAIDNAFSAMSRERPEALIVVPHPRYFQNRQHIINHAAKHRLPAIYSQAVYVEDGGLISYGADYVDEYRRLAIYVDKILKGAKHADLPVEQPTKFELVINLKAAKQIGLNVLARADRVIK